MSTSLTNTIASDEEVVLRWQVHLAKEQPRKLAGIIIATMGLGILTVLWFQSWIPAIVMLFAFLGSVSDFLFPVTYTLTKTHASARTSLGPVGLRTMAWADVRKVYLDDCGIKLSPLRRQSRLEAYRGVFLRFGDKRKEVLDAVQKLRPKDV